MFLVVYQDTGAQLRSEIDRDISGDTSQMIQSLNATNGQRPSRIMAAATRLCPDAAVQRHFDAVVRTDSRRHRPKAITPRCSAAGPPDEGETEAQQRIENAEGKHLEVPHVGFSTALLADVGRMRLYERRADLGTVHLVVGAGEPLALVERAQHGVARAFVLAGAIVLILALVASYLAGARVSAPLRRMAQVATLVDAGDLDPRMEISGQPPPTRCGYWRTRSTACSTGSPRHSPASVSSSPTRRTSYARR